MAYGSHTLLQNGEKHSIINSVKRLVLAAEPLPQKEGTRMLRIAIVEDNNAAAQRLNDCLGRYARENSKEFAIDIFRDAIPFLERYRQPYDLIFMDIDLPGMNGMEAASRLRQIDQRAVLIFVTNLVRFALKGYEVDAMDYLIKPIQYGMFALKLHRAVARCEENTDSILVTQQSGVQRLGLGNLLYVEVRGHKLLFHTEKGEAISGSGTLMEVEEKLRGKGFLRCNKCYLINQKHVAAVQGNNLMLSDGTELLISRQRKKGFLTELADAMGSGNVL